MKNIETKQKELFILLHVLALSLLIMSILFEPITNVISGYYKILTSSSNLLTDYMYIGGVGAAFFNAFTILIFSIYTTKYAKSQFNGADIAAIILVTGFAFFGKNILNSVPLTLGVFVYARIFKAEKSAVILQALYITALAPLVSEIIFSFELAFLPGTIIAYLVGIVIGFVVTPLSRSFLRFHNGYNLYNIGFTAGILAMLIVAIFRMFDLQIETVSFLYEGKDLTIKVYLFVLFLFMILYGFIRNNKSFKGYTNIMKSSGRLPSDFMVSFGLYPTLINMGIMGIISCLYVILCNGIFNGPVIGGIFSVSAFAAFGKHPKNSIPILIGVYIAGLLNIHEPSSTSSLLAGLFGTTLSPIAGEFGPILGILAGFLHMAMVFNVGGVYGGANLYNNGFSGGFIAAIMVPIITEFQQLANKLKGDNDE